MNLQTPKFSKLDRAQVIILVLSAAILVFLFWWIYFKESAATSAGEWLSLFPYANAFWNLLTSIFLLFGYRQIKVYQNVENHKKYMLAAVTTSALFLISYLFYHYFHGDTKFLATGLLRIIYFFILGSHILLSMLQIPLILATLFYAFTDQRQMHKKVAKITFPIWLYVSVTGVIIVFFLKVLN
jgi:putative membrane protein